MKKNVLILLMAGLDGYDIEDIVEEIKSVLPPRVAGPLSPDPLLLMLDEGAYPTLLYNIDEYLFEYATDRMIVEGPYNEIHVYEESENEVKDFIADVQKRSKDAPKANVAVLSLEGLHSPDAIKITNRINELGNVIDGWFLNPYDVGYATGAGVSLLILYDIDRKVVWIEPKSIFTKVSDENFRVVRSYEPKDIDEFIAVLEGQPITPNYYDRRTLVYEQHRANAHVMRFSELVRETKDNHKKHEG